MQNDRKRAAQIKRLRERGISLVADGKFKEAVAVYDELSAIDPTEGEWPRRAADCCWRLKDQKRRLHYAVLAARAYSKSGLLLKAIAMCKVALSIDPGHRESKVALAQLHSRKPTPKKLPVPDGVRRVGAPKLDAARAMQLAQEKLEAGAKSSRGHNPPGRLRARMSAAAALRKARAQKHLRDQRKASGNEHEPRVPGDAIGRLALKKQVVESPTAREIELPPPPPSSTPEPSAPSFRLPPPPNSTHASLSDISLSERVRAEARISPVSEWGNVYALILEEVPRAREVGKLPPERPLRDRYSSGPETRPEPPGPFPFHAQSPPHSLHEEAEPPETVAEFSDADVHDADVADAGLVDTEGTPPTVPRTAVPDDTPEPVVPSNDSAGPPPSSHSPSESVRAALDRREADRQTLAQTPLFGQLDADLLEYLIDLIAVIELEVGEVLFREGDIADTMYVIVEGGVVATCAVQGAPTIELARLGEGEFFGEIGLLSDQARQATVSAHEPTRLLRFDRATVGFMSDQNPEFIGVLLNFLKTRLVENLMLTSPIFAPFGDEERHSLLEQFEFLEVEPDSLLLDQNQPPIGMYVLLAGQALMAGSSGKANRLRRLSPGDIFGEQALLYNQNSQVQVRTTSKCFALCLPSDAFSEIIMTHPTILEYLGSLSEDDNKHVSSDFLDHVSFY